MDGAPVITRQPLGGQVGHGSDLTMAVEASGSSPLRFQWYRNGSPLAGENGAALWLRNAVAELAGDYYVVVSDDSGSVSTVPATVGVVGPPARMWSEAQSLSRRSFHDFAGGVFLIYNQAEPYANTWGGRLTSRLVRLHEATGDIDTTFNWNDRHGTPTTVAVRPDNGLYVGVMLGDKEGGTVVKVDVTGSRDPTFIAPIFDRMIRYLTLQPDGKLLVAFDLVIPSRIQSPGVVLTGAKALYRLNVDGTIDSTFTPLEIAPFWTFIAPPQLDASGRIYLCNVFGPVQGVETRHLIRVSAGGVIDPTYPNWESAPTGFNRIISSFAVQPDGKVVLAGRFTNVLSEQPLQPVVAVRFGSDGNFDSSFQHTLLFAAFPNASGDSDYPRAIVTTLDGGFALMGAGLARFATNGALIATTDLEAGFPFMLSRSPSTGRFFVSGGLNSGTHGGVQVIEPDGTIFTGFVPGLLGIAPSASSAIALDDGRVLAGGAIHYDGLDRRPGTVLFDRDGKVSSSSTPFHDPQRTLDLPSTKLMQWSDGSFLTYTSARLNRAGSYSYEATRFFADGQRDTAWSGAAGFRMEAGPAGTYFMWNPPGIYSAYSVSSSGGASLLRRYDAAGQLDESFQAELPDVCRFSFIDNVYYTAEIGALLCVRAASDGGAFVAIVTYDGEMRVVKLRANGSRDTSFNSPVLATVPRTSGSWYNSVPVGPLFYQKASVLAFECYSRPVDLAVMPDGSVFVTGLFSPEGRPRGIARLNPDGSFSADFTGSGLGLQDASLHPAGTRLAVDTAGRVYLGGRFDSVNGHPASGLVRFSSDGVLDLGWQPGIELRDDLLGGPVLLARDGWLHVFGDVRYSGRPHTAEYLRVLLDPAAPSIVAPPQSTTASAGTSVTFTAAMDGTAPFTFQWYRDSAPIVGATGPAFTIPSVTAADAGAYTVEVSNGSGSVLSEPATLTVTVAADSNLAFYSSSEVAPARAVPDDQGGVYVFRLHPGRAFNVLNGTVVPLLVRLHEETGAVDETFAWDDALGEPTAIAVQPDGKLLVAVGLGYREGGAVVRVNRDGSRDASFSSPYFVRQIRWLALQQSGKVLVLTDQTAHTGVAPAGALDTAAAAVHRLNADGSTDTSFSVATLFSSQPFSAPVVDSEGRIYLAGQFSAVNGVSRPGIARLLADGGLDSDYASPATLPAGWQSSFSSRGVLLQPDGRAVFVGNFWYTGRGSSSNPIVAVRFEPNGTLDAGFAQPLRSSIPGANAAVPRYPAALGAGKFAFLTDRVSQFSADGTLESESPSIGAGGLHMARSPTSGRLFIANATAPDGRFVTARVASDLSSVEFWPGNRWGRTEGLQSAATLADGRIVVAGGVDRLGGMTVPDSFVIAENGNVDFTTTDFFTLEGGGARPFARVIARPEGGFYLLRGDLAATNPVQMSLTRHDGSGARDENWAYGDPSSSSLLAPASGGILYVTPATASVAALLAGLPSATDWIQRLGNDGVPDPGFGRDTSWIFSIERDSVGGAIARIHLGRLLAVKAAPDGALLAIAAVPNGQVKMVRILPTGERDTAFAEPVLAAAETALGFTSSLIFDPVTGVSAQQPTATYSSGAFGAWLIDADGRSYLGGSFVVAGQPKTLIRVLADGTIDASFSPVFANDDLHPLQPRLLALARDHDGRIYAAGRFTKVDEAFADGLVRFASDGSVDQSWRPGIKVHARDLRPLQLVAKANDFHVFGLVSRTGDALVGSYRNAPIDASAPTITLPPAGATVSLGAPVTLIVAATGTGELAYQWRKDGEEIPGATQSDYSIESATLESAGRYDVVVTNAFGSAISSGADVAVERWSQAITFAAEQFASLLFTADPITLVATSTSGLSVAFEVISGEASVSGNQLTLLDTGSVTIRATQPGNASWLAAEPVERTFTVGGSFSSWLLDNFTPEQIQNTALSGPNADGDSDGLPNLVEYALGLDPKVPSRTGLPAVTRTTTDWVFTYTRPAARSDVTYTVQSSTNLTAWTDHTATRIVEGSTETWRVTVPVSGNPNLFFRLKVTR